MHIAGRYNHPECIAPLLDAGAELDALDAASNTPLSLAAWQNHCEVIQQFVLMGANVDLVIDSNRKETIRTCGKEFNISKLLCQPWVYGTFIIDENEITWTKWTKIGIFVPYLMLFDKTSAYNTANKVAFRICPIKSIRLYKIYTVMQCRNLEA